MIVLSLFLVNIHLFPFSFIIKKQHNPIIYSCSTFLNLKLFTIQFLKISNDIFQQKN